MNGGEIRQAAKMYALIAEMEAVKARIEGMKVENELRTQQGLSNAYGGNHFMEAEEALMKIADRLRDEI
jgi:hypothetical protein